MEIIKDYDEVVKVNKFFAKIDLCPIYIGLGGCGKTAMQASYAKEVGKPFISVPMSTYTTPSSVVGKGQFDDEKGRLKWDDVVPCWFPCYRWDAERGIEVETSDETQGLPPVYDKNGKVKSHPAVILLDELNQTEICLQGWLLTAVLSKIVAHQKMHKDVEFVAACNPKEGEYAFVVKRFNPSLAGCGMSRFIPFRFEASRENWKEFITKRCCVSVDIKNFVSEYGLTEFDSERQGTCERSCTEFFKGLDNIQDIVKDKTLQKIANSMITSENTQVLLSYAMKLSEWSGEKIFAGTQKIKSWHDMEGATNSLISYIGSHELTASELKIWELMVLEKWTYDSGVVVALKARAMHFAHIVSTSKTKQLELTNPIKVLQAQAVASGIKKQTATKSFG